MTEIIALGYTITKIVLYATAIYAMFLMLFSGWSVESTRFGDIVVSNIALFIGCFGLCFVLGLIAFIVGIFHIVFPAATFFFASAFAFVIVKAFMVRVKQAFFERR